MKITVTYELGESWKEYETCPPECIHEVILQQIEKEGFVKDTKNVRVEKYVEQPPVVLGEPKEKYPKYIYNR